MKRSNLFLALTTGCLAVVSFAFTKSHTRATANAYCTTAGSGRNCTVLTVKAFTTVKPGSGLHTLTCAGGKTAHTRNAVTNACNHTLYTRIE